MIKPIKSAITPAIVVGTAFFRPIFAWLIKNPLFLSCTACDLIRPHDRPLGLVCNQTDVSTVTGSISMTSPALSTPCVHAAGRHLPALALMRFIAVAGVIWTHACGQIKWMGSGFDFADAGRFGSAFFTQCSVFLVMLKAFQRSDLSPSENAAGRFRRVYVPFVLWSLIYAFNIQFRHLILPDTEAFEWDIAILWNGSVYHLWFLPFIFIVGIILFGFAKWLLSHSRLAIPCALALVMAGSACGAIFLHVDPDTFPRDYMFRLAWNRMPSVCWAAAFAIFYQFGGSEILRTRTLLVFGAALLALSITALGIRPYWHPFENLAGVAGLMMGLSVLNEARLDWATPLARLTYGMYLCHLLFLGLFRTVWHKLVSKHDDYTFALIAATFTLVASAIASAVLRRIKGLRILVPA